ncbi:hypothetical protein OIU74_003826 [Salix koriyanagi]|uniref:Uncharacterized protein n=1 Tax=Salix koriyanagi TaxID=2511006 RepID=A0A9Q0UYQ1_9ROSI|nr:hypothetical protein OIU74_003826 [Salix koriyanagi]
MISLIIISIGVTKRRVCTGYTVLILTIINISSSSSSSNSRGNRDLCHLNSLPKQLNSRVFWLQHFCFLLSASFFFSTKKTAKILERLGIFRERKCVKRSDKKVKVLVLKVFCSTFVIHLGRWVGGAT